MIMGLVGWWFKKLFFTGLRIGTTEHFVDIVFMVIIWCHRLLFFLAVSLLSRQHLLLRCTGLAEEVLPVYLLLAHAVSRVVRSLFTSS